MSPSPGASTSFAHALAMTANQPSGGGSFSHSLAMAGNQPGHAGVHNPMMMHHLQANQPLALHPHMHQGSGHIATSFGYGGSGGNTPGSGSGGISTLISAIPSRTGSPRREHIQGTNGGNNPGGLSPYSPNGAGGSPNNISPGSGGAVPANHMLRSNSLAAMGLGRGSPGSVPSGTLGGRDAPRNSIAIPMSPNGMAGGVGVGVGGGAGPVVGVPGVVAVGSAQVRHVSPSRALVSPLPSQGLSGQTYHAAQAQLAHAQSQAHASMLHSIARNVTSGASPQPGFNRLSPGVTGPGGPNPGSVTATVVKRRTSLAPGAPAVVGSAPAVVGVLGSGGGGGGGYPVQPLVPQQLQPQPSMYLPPAQTNGARQGSLGRVSREFDEVDETQQQQGQGGQSSLTSPILPPATSSNSMPLGSYQAHQPAHVHIPQPHHLAPLVRSPSSMLLPPTSGESGSGGSPQNLRFTSNSAPGSSGGFDGSGAPMGLQGPDRTLSPTPNQLQPLSRSHGPSSLSHSTPGPAASTTSAGNPAAGGLSLTMSADDALAAAVAASFTEGLSPSANITPSSSSHRRICSLPLYVSARKPRAYKSHITYSASGGIMKENSIGIGVGQAPPLTVAPGGVLMPLSPAPIAAAAAAAAAAAGASSAASPAPSVVGGFTPLLPLSSETSLIDSEAGYTFQPQRHTQAFKSHFQKKSHQAVFALFAAIDPPGGPGSGQVQMHPPSFAQQHSFGSAGGISVATTNTSGSAAPTPMPLSPSSATVGGLPAAGEGPLSAGGQSTDEDSALEAWLGAGGSLESGPRSPHSPSTAAALLASALSLAQSGPTDVGKFYAQFFRAHFIEMMETHYPSASANPAAAPGGGLSAEESKVALHGIVQLTIRAMEQECMRAHPSVCITGAGCSFCVLLISGGWLYTYNSFFISQDPRFPSLAASGAAAAAAAGAASGAVVPAPSPPLSVGGAQQQAKEQPPLAPFHAMLSRQGRGLDLSVPESAGGAGPMPLPLLPPASPATVAAWRGGGVDQVAERQLMQGDEFVLLSSLPLSRQMAAIGLPPADGSHPLPPSAASIGAAVASAPFPDVASMCHFVTHSPTPQETVTRIVDAHTRATAAVPAEKRPNLIMTLVYF